MKMNLMKIVLLIEVSYVVVHGAAGGSHQNVFSKATQDFGVVGQRPQHDDDKKLFITENQIIEPSKDSSSYKAPSVTKPNKKRRGKGRKRDPCQRKYKDFCFNGECRYIRALKEPSCICQVGYYGERCQAFTLRLENPSDSYDHTTMLAVVAVALSSFCLLIISSLLAVRYHRRGAYNVENEEKFKLRVGA
ncbi:proheparin-binding EGF-like growth factor [Spea bombifrons]|uniref:proheparin-binding EGF-like growth factor n=1 Tax=Spea bombifrons TaxID=233779 RepID=UPI00234A1450|nr:proheparin-binding EGF-like growth factor [Spea bombifrons]